MKARTGKVWRAYRCGMVFVAVSVVGLAYSHPVRADCEDAIMTWNGLAAQIQGWQVQEVRVWHQNTDTYITTRDRGLAGATVIKQPICGDGIHHVQIRFGRECIKTVETAYYTSPSTECTWGDWRTVAVLTLPRIDAVRPRPPIIIQI